MDDEEEEDVKLVVIIIVIIDEGGVLSWFGLDMNYVNFFFIIYWNCFIRLGDESGGRGLD